MSTPAIDGPDGRLQKWQHDGDEPAKVAAATGRSNRRDGFHHLADALRVTLLWRLGETEAGVGEVRDEFEELVDGQHEDRVEAEVGEGLGRHL